MSDMKYKLMVSEVEAKKAMKEFADSICKNYIIQNNLKKKCENFLIRR